MNEIDKYRNSPVPIEVDFMDEGIYPETSSSLDLGGILKRRWHIILICAVLVAAVGLPAVWYGVKPVYISEGAIHVKPVLVDIFNKRDSGDISNYQVYMNTQSDLMKQNYVIDYVAEKLAEQPLQNFTEGQDPRTVLRTMLVRKDIKIDPERGKEFIKIVAAGPYKEESQRIVNHFLDAYMAIYVTAQDNLDRNKLSELEKYRQTKLNDKKILLNRIRDLAEGFGYKDLDLHQETEMELLKLIKEENLAAEFKKLRLEMEIKLLEQSKGDSKHSSTLSDSSLAAARTSASD